MGGLHYLQGRALRHRMDGFEEEALHSPPLPSTPLHSPPLQIGANGADSCDGAGVSDPARIVSPDKSPKSELCEVDSEQSVGRRPSDFSGSSLAVVGLPRCSCCAVAPASPNRNLTSGPARPPADLTRIISAELPPAPSQVRTAGRRTDNVFSSGLLREAPRAKRHAAPEAGASEFVGLCTSVAKGRLWRTLYNSALLHVTRKSLGNYSRGLRRRRRRNTPNIRRNSSPPLRPLDTHSECTPRLLNMYSSEQVLNSVRSPTAVSTKSCQNSAGLGQVWAKAGQIWSKLANLAGFWPAFFGKGGGSAKILTTNA